MPTTATEKPAQPVQVGAAIARLIRADARRRLRDALGGGVQARWDYCWLRELSYCEARLLYGASPDSYDAPAAARRVVRNYLRLKRIGGDNDRA
jgi:hypothetical protein